MPNTKIELANGRKLNFSWYEKQQAELKEENHSLESRIKAFYSASIFLIF